VKTEPYNILFRCDSSSQIGIGHVMRDLVLANELRKQERGDVLFACQNLPGNINTRISENGFKIIEIQENSEVELIETIGEYDINCLVIDHYEIESPLEMAILDSGDVKVVVIDDKVKEHNCNILLNHNICSKDEWYEDKVDPDTVLFTGKKHTLIRDEIKLFPLPENRIIGEDKVKVVVSLGGSDPNNLIPEILNSLEQFPLDIKVLTSSSNKHLPELKEYCESRAHIQLIVDQFQISELVNRSHFAVISPSVLSAEMLYMEMPFIAVKTVPNQANMYKYLTDEGLYTTTGENLSELPSLVNKLLDQENYSSYYQKIKKYKMDMSSGINDLTDEIYS
jgi:UDP-2,4-diacetamido-2,4,6-trideoxy-beta-L-altropyranose hydrolase